MVNTVNAVGKQKLFLDAFSDNMTGLGAFAGSHPPVGLSGRAHRPPC